MRQLFNDIAAPLLPPGPVGAPDFTPATVSDAQWYLDGWNMG